MKSSFILKVLVIFCCVVLVSGMAVPAQAANRDAELTAEINRIISTIPADCDTDSEIALFLHDYVVNHVVYEKVGDHQTAFGALLDGKAVCAGYADAYKRLLNAAGITAYTVIGHALDPDGNQVGHAWNMVILDGKCYFTDTTWDDVFIGNTGEQMLVYSYFNLSLEQMSLDHYLGDNPDVPIPDHCNHTGNDYYTIKAGPGTGVGIANPSTTASEIAKYFKLTGMDGEKGIFVCEFRFDGDNVQGWIQNNLDAIATALGMNGYSASYMMGDRFGKITLTGKTALTNVKVTGVSLNKTSHSMTSAGETFQLKATITPSNATNKAVTYSSSNTSVATVSASGLVTAKGNGTAVITVKTADGGKTAQCTITVSIKHTHSLRTVKAVSPSCVKEGSTLYYVCDGCGTWFSDAAGTKVITDHNSVKLSKTAHSPSGWNSDDSHHWKSCTTSGCTEKLSYGAHTDSNNDHKCDTCSKNLQSGSEDVTVPTDPSEENTVPSTGFTEQTEPATEPSTETIVPGDTATDPSTESNLPTETPSVETTAPGKMPTDEGEGNSDLETPDNSNLVMIAIAAGSALILCVVILPIVLKKKK